MPPVYISRTSPGAERFRRVQPADGATEERLLARAKAGDLAAFNRLLEPRQGLLYAIALRMLGDEPSAADVTQESLLAAWQHLEGFHGGSFRAWLTRILINRCYDALRSRRRKPEQSYDAILAERPETEQLAGEAPDPAQLVVTHELGRHLSAGLASLPPDQRAVLILCDVQGYGYAEAAEVERTNIGTIKSRLSRGRARLRDWLADRPELLPSDLRSVYRQEKQ
jgi:RNA polymerase sigma-70 factor, ECF subfamily